MSEWLDDAELCVDRTLAAVGPRLVIATPLGLGKPVQLLNAFYRRALADPSISVHIVTALCLSVPQPEDPIEAGLAAPIIDRLFGDYEELAFLAPLRAGTLPANVQVTELYFRPGAMKGVAAAQQAYICSNYTHIARDMGILGVNVLAQLVAAREEGDKTWLSLSCNPDLTLELFEQFDAQTGPVLRLAQVHPDLPFMEHDARIPFAAFDLVLRHPRYDRRLFAVPNSPASLTDYAIALHASSLIVDGGTLQIGIGALGDALAHTCILRHTRNADYRALLEEVTVAPPPLQTQLGPFEQGLYVCTEMFVNGMLHLIERGIVRRRVYDQLALQQALNAGQISEAIDAQLYDSARAAGLMPARLSTASLRELQYWGILPAALRLDGDALSLAGVELANDLDLPATRAVLLAAMTGRTLRHGRVLHGGFLLGPRDFYQKLCQLDAEGHARIAMTGVRRTNQLLLDYPLYSAQRRAARFINTGMLVTLDGAVTSDALEDGTVISGVGGQYNFVAMAHDLPDARSLLCIRSTRGHGRDVTSNVLPHYGHTTIPKHLRDVVVTEYGVADLRGRSDADVIKRLINIADSRFQAGLLEFAQAHGKLPPDYRIPEHASNNTPERLRAALAPARAAGTLPDYPFGTELTSEEVALTASLRNIRTLSEEPARFVAQTLRALLHRGDADAARPWLQRVALEHPDTPREFIVQQLLLLELEQRGLLKGG